MGLLVVCGFIEPLEMDSTQVEAKPAGRGALIVFEGIDGCGKTTLSRHIESFLVANGHPAKVIQFPDRSTATGKLLDSYLKGDQELPEQALHVVFSANRWEALPEILALLNAGTTVLLDRYAYSGLAYSNVRGLDDEFCKAADRGLPAPDLIIYFQISPEKVLEQNRKSTSPERGENLDFQKKVYKRLAEVISYEFTDKFMLEEQWNFEETVEALGLFVLGNLHIYSQSVLRGLFGDR